MTRCRAALAAFLLFGLSTTSATAGTTISKSISYYSVSGRTADELDAALSKRGPLMRSTGTRHPGATKIRFGGTITYALRDGICVVGSADVTLSTKLILPRWTNRKRSTRDLALIWDTLASDIKRHEERHAEIARNHARTLERDLLRLRPEKDCKRLQDKAAEVSIAAIETHDKDQARFDRSEAANFDKRMMRLLEYRVQTLKRAGALD